MSEEQAKVEESTENAAAEAAPEEKKGEKAMKPRIGVDKEKLSRRTIRAKARRWLKEAIRDDKEFAKGYFEAKSKRSAEKKLAFRKRHSSK